MNRPDGTHTSLRDALAELVDAWRYNGKAANATEDDLIRDECADELEAAMIAAGEQPNG